MKPPDWRRLWSVLAATDHTPTAPPWRRRVQLGLRFALGALLVFTVVSAYQQATMAVRPPEPATNVRISLKHSAVVFDLADAVVLQRRDRRFGSNLNLIAEKLPASRLHGTISVPANELVVLGIQGSAKDYELALEIAPAPNGSGEQAFRRNVPQWDMVFVALPPGPARQVAISFAPVNGGAKPELQVKQLFAFAVPEAKVPEFLPPGLASAAFDVTDKVRSQASRYLDADQWQALNAGPVDSTWRLAWWALLVAGMGVGLLGRYGWIDAALFGGTAAAIMVGNNFAALLGLDLPLNLFVGSVAAPSGNLSYGVTAALEFLQTHRIAAFYNEQRLFGYPLFCSIAGVVGASGKTFVDVYLAVVAAHGLVAFLGFGLLATCLVRMVTAPAAVLAVAWLSTRMFNLHYVQVDSLILPVWYFVMAASLLLLRSPPAPTSPRLRMAGMVLMNLALAALTALRGEFLPLWILYVAGATVFGRTRDWQLFAVLCAGFVAIQSSCASANAGSFRFRAGTLNTGHVAFVGLWENDWHPFVWEATDHSYDLWVSSHHFTYNSVEAAQFARPEVLKFYAHFPAYTAMQASDKFNHWLKEYVGYAEMDGHGTWPQRATVLRAVALVLLFAGLFFVLDFRTPALWVYLGALGFALPLFCLIQQSGNRFTMYLEESLPVIWVIGFAEAAWSKRRAGNWVRVGLVGAALLLATCTLPVGQYLHAALKSPFSDHSQVTLFQLRPGSK